MTIFNHHDRVKLTAEGRELLEEIGYPVVSLAGLVIGSPDQNGAVKVMGFCDSEMVSIHSNWITKVGRLVPGTPVTIRSDLSVGGLEHDPVKKGDKGFILESTRYDDVVQFPDKLMATDDHTGERHAGYAYLDETDFIADESKAVRALKPAFEVSALRVRIGDVLMDDERQEFAVDHIDATLWWKFGVKFYGSAGEVRSALHVTPGDVEAGRLVPVYYRADR